MATAPERLDPDQEQRLAATLFNATWDLLEHADRTLDQDDEMLHLAHAARHHWGRVGTAVHRVRGEWQCSRVYAVLGRAEPALHHARRTLDLCTEHGIADFDLAYAYEAMARAEALAGDTEQAQAFLTSARQAVEQITEDDDREIVLADLATITI